jgi:hypothetical protein
MKVFQFKVYDPDAGEIDLGFFKTRALAMRQKKHLEDEIGHKLDNQEYEFIDINVIDYITKTIPRPKKPKNRRKNGKLLSSPASSEAIQN